MSTPLSLIYDAFFIKANDSFLYKNSQVFHYLKTGISNSLKTTKDDLTFNYFTNDLIFIILNQAQNNGNIQININSNIYIISLLSTDNKIDIANKIKMQLENDYNIELDIKFDNPIILIKSKIDSVNLNENIVDPKLTDSTFKDLGNTKLNLIVTRQYDGEFIYDIKQDSIELISLYMLYEHKRYRKSDLDKIKQHVGTKDFNKLPDKVEEYKLLDQSMKELKREIENFRNEFYTY